MAYPKNIDKQKLESQDTLSWNEFIGSVGSAATKETYTFALLDYIKAMGYNVGNTDSLLIEDSKIIGNKITRYFLALKNKGNLSPRTLIGRFVAIKRFYTIQPEGPDINWKRIWVYFVRNANGKRRLDIPYDYEQIQKMLNIADIRMRVCILCMCGAGLRRGALSGLTLGCVKPVQFENYNLVQLTVYPGEREEYETFGTPELKAEIDNYISYRKRYGEPITYNKDKRRWEPHDSPLIREQFDINDIEAVKKPRFVTTATLKVLIHRLLYRSGLRTKENMVTGRGSRYANGLNSESHSLRKFYRTQLFNGEVDPLIAEMLLGHGTGLVGDYTKPTEKQQLEQFTKAISKLTISEEERKQITIERLEAESEKQKATFLKAIEERESRYDGILSELAKMKEDMNQLRK